MTKTAPPGLETLRVLELGGIAALRESAVLE